jgi:hypothetical protein
MTACAGRRPAFLRAASAHALLEMGPGFLARCKVPIGHVLRLEPGSV